MMESLGQILTRLVMNPTAKAGGLSLYYAAMFCSGSETIGAMTNALARMFRAAFSSA